MRVVWVRIGLVEDPIAPASADIDNVVASMRPLGPSMILPCAVEIATGPSALWMTSASVMLVSDADVLVMVITVWPGSAGRNRANRAVSRALTTRVCAQHS